MHILCKSNKLKTHRSYHRIKENKGNTITKLMKKKFLVNGWKKKLTVKS